MNALRPYLNAKSVEELWAHQTTLMAGYGFDRLFYAYTCFQTANTLSDPRDALVLSNHPADYVDAYVTRGLFRDGPMLNWATRNVGSTSWRIPCAEATAELPRMRSTRSGRTGATRSRSSTRSRICASRTCPPAARAGC